MGHYACLVYTMPVSSITHGDIGDHSSPSLFLLVALVLQ